MRILLIGCTGFVGRELIPKLLNEKHEICVISRNDINDLKFDLPIKKFNFL